jgi:imidazole glycerol phosphate synthase glutamine amidotransferase subunit
MSPTITLLDYGAGNLPSVERTLHQLGASTQRVSTADKIAAASAIVLPGVGHFAALIRALNADGIREALIAAIRRGVPFLGICLGLQALYEMSEEAPDLRGLTIFAGAIRALQNAPKLPHMGWNQIQSMGAPRLLDGIAPDAFFYFAHSYAAVPDRATPMTEARATCSYGSTFVAALEKDNIFAVQFHPEKSAEAGRRVLQNFLQIVTESRAQVEAGLRA